MYQSIFCTSRLLLFLILFSSFGRINARTVHLPNVYHHELNLQYGSVADGTNAHTSLVTGPAYGINYRATKRIDKATKVWHAFYNKPILGYEVSFLDFNNVHLGHAFYGSKLVDFLLLSRKAFSWNIQASVGAAFFTKKFDSESNYQNTYISKNFNITFGFRTHVKYQFLSDWSVLAGLEFDHFSNGETRIPNEGLNTRMLFAGFKYTPSSWQFSSMRKGDSVLQKKNVHQIQVTGGRKENWRYGDRKYWVQNISYDFMRKINAGQYLSVGLDAFYDQSDQFYSNRNTDPAESFDQAISLGIHFGHDLNLYPVHIVLQFGTYIAGRRASNNSVYQMTGFKYYFNPRLYLSLIHKSHFFFKGDHLAWGVGFNL